MKIKSGLRMPNGGAGALCKRLMLYGGIAAAFGVISHLAFARDLPVLIAPFAASACILFMLPDTRAARARNVILGHILSAAVGVLSREIGGVHWVTSALCVASAVAAMDLTDTMHPPAAATSLLALTASQGYRFVLAPAALGACLLVLVSEIVKFAARCVRADEG